MEGVPINAWDILFAIAVGIVLGFVIAYNL